MTSELISPPPDVEIIGPSPLDSRADHHEVLMRDRVALATDVYLPDPGSLPAPAILVRIPYDKCGRYTFMPQLAAYVAERGFAAVIQDVRGRFRSEGEREPFLHEVADGWDALEWIEQQAWSTGSVGMVGDSYYGFTQWAAAASGHRALKAIVPRVTGSWFGRYYSPDEVPRVPFFAWLFETWTWEGLYEGELIHDPPSTPGGPRIPPWLGDGALQRLRELVDREERGELARQVYPNGNPATSLQIPALHVGGWWDNLQKCQLDDWHTIASAPARDHQYLRMGCTDHEDFTLQELQVAGENHETDDAALERYLPRMLDEPLSFLEHYLRGGSGPWPAPRVRFETANSSWEDAPAWPPPQASALTLFLTDGAAATSSSDGGQMTTRPGEPSQSARWVHDPAEPVAFLQDTDWGMLLQQRDEAPAHARCDVATFTLQPPLRDLVGPVIARLIVVADAPTSHVVVRLHDVYPDGRARFLLGDAAVANTSAGPAEVTVRLGDIAYRIRPGHRLRVAISSSCSGLYLVHSGTDEDPWTATRTRRIEHQLHIGGERGSRLELTVRQ